MKNPSALMFVLVMCAVLSACARPAPSQTAPPPPSAPAPQSAAVMSSVSGLSDEDAASDTVVRFGQRLQNVSLLAPPDTLRQSLEENYAELVTPELLEAWKNDPQNAPGRRLSSPWPDRIEIQSTEALPDGEISVHANIIEITSVEKETGGAAATRPITLAVKNTGGRWLITHVTLGDEISGSQKIVYENFVYGFRFSLPPGWADFTVETSQWQGTSLTENSQSNDVETGPLLSIRHPAWTPENPRQDIPIMVFTLSQWNIMQNDEFHIGAAPVNPSELGRNSRYVFALPARYNFAFPEGFEEVETILQGRPLEPTENFAQDAKPAGTKRQDPALSKEIRTRSGRYQGLADNNFFEVELDSSSSQSEFMVFMLTDEIRPVFENFSLDKDDRVEIDSYANKFGQNIVVGIRRID